MPIQIPPSSSGHHVGNPSIVTVRFLIINQYLFNPLILVECPYDSCYSCDYDDNCQVASGCGGHYNDYYGQKYDHPRDYDWGDCDCDHSGYSWDRYDDKQH